METQATYQKSSKVDSSNCRLEWLVLSQRPLLKAYLGDCMDLMASTADNYYDLAIVLVLSILICYIKVWKYITWRIE